jgi:hypothetical protein
MALPTPGAGEGLSARPYPSRGGLSPGMPCMPPSSGRWHSSRVRTLLPPPCCSALLPPTRGSSLCCRLDPIVWVRRPWVRPTGQLLPAERHRPSILQCEWPGRPLTGSILLPSLSVVAITVADGIGWCGSTFPTLDLAVTMAIGAIPYCLVGCHVVGLSVLTYVAGPCLAFPWLWGVLSHVWTRGEAWLGVDGRLMGVAIPVSIPSPTSLAKLIHIPTP